MILLHLTNELRKAGSKLTKAAKSELQGQGMVASGNLKNSIHSKVTTSGLEPQTYAKLQLFSLDYGRDAEYGKKPHTPNPGKLAAWAKEIGLPDCAVPLISRRIEEFGTPTPPLTVRWCQDEGSGELHDGGGLAYSNNGRRTKKYGGGFVDVAYKLVRFKVEAHAVKGLAKDIENDIVRKLRQANDRL